MQLSKLTTRQYFQLLEKLQAYENDMFTQELAIIAYLDDKEIDDIRKLSMFDYAILKAKYTDELSTFSYADIEPINSFRWKGKQYKLYDYTKANVQHFANYEAYQQIEDVGDRTVKTIALALELDDEHSEVTNEQLEHLVWELPAQITVGLANFFLAEWKNLREIGVEYGILVPNQMS